jgi:hypothetical protein
MNKTLLIYLGSNHVDISTVSYLVTIQYDLCVERMH